VGRSKNLKKAIKYEYYTRDEINEGGDLLPHLEEGFNEVASDNCCVPITRSGNAISAIIPMEEKTKANLDCFR